MFSSPLYSSTAMLLFTVTPQHSPNFSFRFIRALFPPLHSNVMAALHTAQYFSIRCVIRWLRLPVPFLKFSFYKIYFSIQRRLEAELRNNFFDDLYIHIRGLTPKTSANTSAWRTLPVVENGRREDVFFFFFLVSCNLGPFGLLFRGRPLDKIPLDMLFYPATPSTNKLCFSFYCSIYFPILMLFSRLLPPLVVEHH